MKDFNRCETIQSAYTLIEKQEQPQVDFIINAAFASFS